jgi:hypothetical protein
MKKICCICGDEDFIGYGNNPWPVAEEGECCDQCNSDTVIPARLKMMQEGNADEE